MLTDSARLPAWFGRAVVLHAGRGLDQHLVRLAIDGLSRAQPQYDYRLPVFYTALALSRVVPGSVVMPKPKVFLGSSSSSLGVLTEFALQLEKIEGQPLEALRWDKAFQAGEYALDAVNRFTQVCQCAVLFFAADDHVIKPDGTSTQRVRDNVVLEYGCFISTRGRKYTMIVAEKDATLPSDTNGVTVLQFDRKSSNLDATLAKIAHQAAVLWQTIPDNEPPLTSVRDWLAGQFASMHGVLGDIRRGQSLAEVCNTVGIQRIFPTRKSAVDEIKERLKQARDVKLLGVSLRQFFHDSFWETAHVRRILSASERKWQILIMDPTSPEAFFRSFREQRDQYESFANEENIEIPANHSTIDKQSFKIMYESLNLYKDVDMATSSLRTLLRVAKARIEARYCVAAPACFLAIVDGALFVEQYHFGVGPDGRSGEHVPVLQFAPEFALHKHLSEHFLYIWNHLSRPI